MRSGLWPQLGVPTGQPAQRPLFTCSYPRGPSAFPSPTQVCPLQTEALTTAASDLGLPSPGQVTGPGHCPALSSCTHWGQCEGLSRVGSCSLIRDVRGRRQLLAPQVALQGRKEVSRDRSRLFRPAGRLCGPLAAPGSRDPRISRSSDKGGHGGAAARHTRSAPVPPPGRKW